VGTDKKAGLYVYGLDGALLAEADGATGATLRDYIWLPVDDVSPAADNDSEEGAQTPPLPLGLVTGVNTPAPSLLMVHADHLGRPVRLTDATRATVWQASYDPFGQPWQITGAVEQNLRFPGQYFLLESGLSYNWHRVYVASTGRYTQPDPLRFVDGPSVYGYATASPMMRVDPEGLSSFCSILGLPKSYQKPCYQLKSGLKSDRSVMHPSNKC
jgi:RHS repeat-associated protein